MSVDARIRAGLTMIDKALPGVDTIGDYGRLGRRVRRAERRRRALIGASVAAALVIAGALLLNQSQEKRVMPAPAPDLPNRVIRFDPTGRVAFIGPDGSQQTIPAKNVDRFALSPGGQQIAYTNATSAQSVRELWIANADGTDPRRLLPASCAGCQPGYGITWSHDGARLAYVVWTPGQTPSQLRIRTLATGREQVFRMPAGLEPRGPSFSPDDRSLAMTMVSDTGQYAATMNLLEGTSSLTRLSDVYTQVVAPSWSQDGRTVYFTATTSGESSADVTGISDLYSIRVDGSGPRQITHAASGERFFGATPYQDEFLISRAVGDGPWVVGWLSSDGRTFTPMKGPDGHAVLGNAPQLQP